MVNGLSIRSDPICGSCGIAKIVMGYGHRVTEVSNLPGGENRNTFGLQKLAK